MFPIPHLGTKVGRHAPLRGDRPKQLLVQSYNLIPIIHSCFVTGDVEHGACGGIEGEFYEFRYSLKSNEEDQGTFRVGYDCGEQILEEMGHPSVTLVHPLVSDITESHTSRTPGAGGCASVLAYDPLAQEVQQVISLLVACTRCNPTEMLADTAALVRREPRVAPPIYRVTALNSYVFKRLSGRGAHLAPFIAALPKGRKLEFPAIAHALATARRQNADRTDPKKKLDDYFDDWVN